MQGKIWFGCAHDGKTRLKKLLDANGFSGSKRFKL